jgi:hypothetical protein
VLTAERRGVWASKGGLLLLLAATLGAAASGCTTAVVQPRSDLRAAMQPGTAVSDDDVLAAYRERPRLPARVRVAFYAFDDQHAGAIGEMLEKLPTVGSVFRLPSFIVSGRGRYDTSDDDAHEPPDIRRLRLMAARARADVVMVFDYDAHVRREANGLAVFGVAIVPLLFTPFQDVAASSYVDGFVVDTRNGYFYGQVSAARQATSDYVTIYSDAGEELIARQRGEMLAEVGKQLDQLFREQRVASGKATHRGDISDTPTIDRDTQDPWAAAPRRLEIVMSGAGVTLDGAPIASPEELRERVRKIARGRNVIAEIRSTRNVAYGRVQETVDMLKDAGVRKVRFAVAPESAPLPEAAPESPPAPTPKGSAPPKK